VRLRINIGPLPEPEHFLTAVRTNLERAQEAQKEFAYTERRTDFSFNPFGRVGTGATRVFDIVPNRDGSIRPASARNRR
jgi:hypothetical protein